jgi:hypothetical protein
MMAEGQSMTVADVGAHVRCRTPQALSSCGTETALGKETERTGRFDRPLITTASSCHRPERQSQAEDITPGEKNPVGLTPRPSRPTRIPTPAAPRR